MPLMDSRMAWCTLYNALHHPDSHDRKANTHEDEKSIQELEREILDLKIANRGKDFLIEQLNKERSRFFADLLTMNRKLGELESKFLK